MNSTNNIGFLFDLDGVIIDSESEYSRIWSLINSEFPTGIENLEFKIKGCTLSKILNDYFPDEKIKDRVKRRLHELEQKMHYNYLPGAYEFLQLLKDNDIPKALVTSSNTKKMKHLQEELPELSSLFDFIVTGDLVKNSKPSPEGYLLAAEKIGMSPLKCFVVEDSLQGVMAGKNAGAFVIGVTGTLPAETIRPYSDLIVNNLSEVNLENLIRNFSNNEQ